MKNGDKSEERSLNFYSRQIGTFGLNTMKKLSKLNIVIFGLRGFGLEIAKNTILSGPNKVFIYDYHISRINDLNNNFYLKKEDIGKKRLDEAVIEKVKNLNDYVDVDLFNSNEKLFETSEIINEEKIFNSLKIINIIIITEICSSNILKKIENYCYENNKGFIYCGCLGLVGFIFNNFGKKFIIDEPYFSQKRTYYITCIKWNKEEDNNVSKQLIIEYDTSMKDTPPLQKGDFITFKEIEGMEFLNQKETPKI
jgi:ubiquitin-activating enzyme E1